MTNIRDIFCICNINICYENDNNEILLTDIETNRLIKICSENNLQMHVLSQLYECLDNYISTTNQFPGSVIIVGNLYYDQNIIYWDVDEICLFTFLPYKFLSCYLDIDKSNKNVLLKDRLSDNEVHIINPSQELNDLQDMLLDDSINNIYSKYNYFNHGCMNILVSGDLNTIVENKYVYQFSPSMMFGDINVLYEELFSLVMEKN